MRVWDVVGGIGFVGFWLLLLWNVGAKELQALFSDAKELENLEGDNESESASPQEMAMAHTNRRASDVATEELNRRELFASRAHASDAQLAIDFDEDRCARLAAEHEEYSKQILSVE